MRNKSIHIGGNIYGCGNIGDDAVLQGVLNEAFRVAPFAQIRVEMFQGKRLPFMAENTQVVDCFDQDEVFASIAESDVYVVGGGTMIGDELTLRFPLEHLAKRIAYAKWMRKKVVFAGVGVNRLQTKEGERIARGLLNISDVVSVRDVPSLLNCKNLCPDRAECFRLAADPAYLLEPIRTARSQRIKDSCAGARRILGVNVLNEAWGHRREYKAAIAEACDHLYEKHGYAIIYFCNEIRPDSYFDWAANCETAALMKCPHVMLEPEYVLPGEMLDIISGFDVVLSLRMHALIFAAIMGVPFVGISRVDKVDYFLGQYGMRSCGDITNVKATQIVDAVQSLSTGWDAKKAAVKNVATSLRDQVHTIGDAIVNSQNAPAPKRRCYVKELLPYFEGISMWAIRYERWRQGDLLLRDIVKRRVDVINVIIDGVIYCRYHHGGIKRCFDEYIGTIAKHESDIHFHVLLSEHLHSFRLKGRRIHVYHLWKGGLCQVVRRVIDRWRLASIKNPIFHSTYYSLPENPRIKSIVTVHDFLHERYQAFMEPESLQQGFCLQKKRAIESATAIVAVSEQTKSDIRSYTKCSDDEISVVYHGVTFSFVLPQVSVVEFLHKYNLENGFWLFVGRGERYKNFDVCFNAWIKACCEGDRAALLIVGPVSPLEERHFASLVPHKLEQRIRLLVNVPDHDLHCAYKGAKALVFPSLHEGFGIPLLEAMAASCPVVASDIPVFHEVAGDAVLYFNPHSMADLVDKMRMVDDPSLRRELIDKGLARSRIFSWDKAGRDLANIYRKVARGKEGTDEQVSDRLTTYQENILLNKTSRE